MDLNIAHDIVDALSDEVGEVVEVGAGMGVLTRYLIPKFGDRLHVVEIDNESVVYLEKAFPELGTAIEHADFLKTDLHRFGDNIAIIGNFPYNISSQIFFHVLKYRDNVIEIVGMLQKKWQNVSVQPREVRHTAF